MKSKLFILLSVFMVMLSASAISAADTNNLNATDATDINDASLDVENVQIDSANADANDDEVIMDLDDTGFTIIVHGFPVKPSELSKTLNGEMIEEFEEEDISDDTPEIDPELQKIIDNLPFEIDPSLIPLLTEGVTPQVKDTEPVADSLKDLQKLIDETPAGSTLALTHNYYRTNDCTAVNINKDITIDGNGYCISFGGSNGHIISKKGHVVLKNLGINSANNDAAGLSTLDILDTATYIIDNCKFFNNQGAGAIYIGSPSLVGESTRKTIIINNCSFSNNDGLEGGAIAIFAPFTTVKIENTSFYKNCADKYGGAIFTRDDVDLKNCTFKNNYVQCGFTHSYGGAVFAVGAVNDDGSSFISNESPDYGGAIVCTKDNTNNNTYFDGNKAGSQGNNILVYDNINKYNFPLKDKPCLTIKQLIQEIR